MKIVHVIWRFNMGGAETLLVDIMNEQSRYAGVHLIVLNDRVDYKLLELVSKKITVHLIRRKEGSRNPVPILKLNGIIFLNKYDVIHCHGQTLIKVIFVGRKRSAATVHGLGFGVEELKSFGKVFAVSQSVRQDVFDRSGLLPKVVYNGINCDQIRMQNHSPLRSDQNFRLVQISRLQHETKGQHILLEALSILSHSYGMNKITVDFIGEGESLGHLSRMANDMGLSERVRFRGLMQRNEIYDQLSIYHALVQPSLWEGFGNTVLEGMAARIPVIVSDIHGPMEIIENGLYGWHFKSGDAQDCAEKIMTLIAQYDSAETHEKVQRAWKRVKDDFDVRTSARNYHDGYL